MHSIQKEESLTTLKLQGKKFNCVFKKKKKDRPLKVNKRKVVCWNFKKKKVRPPQVKRKKVWLPKKIVRQLKLFEDKSLTSRPFSTDLLESFSLNKFLGKIRSLKMNGFQSFTANLPNKNVSWVSLTGGRKVSLPGSSRSSFTFLPISTVISLWCTVINSSLYCSVWCGVPRPTERDCRAGRPSPGSQRCTANHSAGRPQLDQLQAGMVTARPIGGARGVGANVLHPTSARAQPSFISIPSKAGEMAGWLVDWRLVSCPTQLVLVLKSVWFSARSSSSWIAEWMDNWLTDCD